MLTMLPSVRRTAAAVAVVVAVLLDVTTTTLTTLKEATANTAMRLLAKLPQLPTALTPTQLVSRGPFLSTFLASLLNDYRWRLPELPCPVVSGTGCPRSGWRRGTQACRTVMSSLRFSATHTLYVLRLILARVHNLDERATRYFSRRFPLFPQYNGSRAYRHMM